MANKKRLIDLSTIGVGARNPNVFIDRERALGWNDLLEILEKAPTVDAVEVVRCRECKRWNPDLDSYGKDDGPKGKCMKSFEVTLDDDFCSYGERKDNDK